MGKRERDRDEDAELWARIASTTSPLKARRIAAKPASAKPKAPERQKRTEQPAKPKAKAQPELVRGSVEAALDRQTSRRLESGRLAVEARLDLHGMKQKDAHAALKRFLKWASSKDLRHVLVITGKGAASDERKSFYEEESRGVLRQAVPHWLASPELAAMVVSFSPAPRRLGGEGALYVRLRKARPGIRQTT
jgi:DNA-nicking Smr family endonuclease